MSANHFDWECPGCGCSLRIRNAATAPSVCPECRIHALMDAVLGKWRIKDDLDRYEMDDFPIRRLADGELSRQNVTE